MVGGGGGNRPGTRGRTTWHGPLRSYDAWSVLRFAPYFLLLAVVIFGWIGMSWWQQVRSDRNKAAQIRAAIELSVSLSPTELDHLWKLAYSSDAVRNSFFEQALEFPATAEQFNRRADVAVQAAVGLDHDRREEIYKTAVLPCLQHPPTHLSIKVACIRIGVGLSKENDNPQSAIPAYDLRVLYDHGSGELSHRCKHRFPFFEVTVAI